MKLLTSKQLFTYLVEETIEEFLKQMFKHAINTKQDKILLGTIVTKDKKVYELYFSVKEVV